MRILQTDDSVTSTRVAEGLRREGHEVFADCLPDSASQQACIGLRSGNCPLDIGADVAIIGSDRGQRSASAGVVCSRRRSVPVVTVGRHDVDHPDLAVALERSARRGDELVGWTVEQALHDVLERLGVPEGTVQLHHDAAYDRIVARVPESMTDSERSRLAVRLLAAATATHRTSSRRDVVVTAG